MKKPAHKKSFHKPTYEIKSVVGYAIPSVLLIISCLIAITPWHIGNFSIIKPNIPIIIMFFWTYIKPSSIHPMILFSAAAILDIFLPVPLGYHCLLYLFISAVILWRALYSPRYSLILFYGEFIIITSLFYTLQWTANSIISDNIRFDANILFSWGMTLITFWIIYPILTWSYRIYPFARIRQIQIRRKLSDTIK